MADMVLIVSYFSILLGFGVIIANLMKKIKIPDTFLLLLVGLLCGPTLWKSGFVARYIDFIIVDVSKMSVVPDFLRTLALVLIVFVGSFNLNFSELKRFSDISVNLAFSLVILNTILIGIAGKLIFGFSWLTAFLIGAIVSGTDASVIFTFEESLKKHRDALTIVKVESILNSPLSVLIPLLLLDLINLSPGKTLAPGVYISQFWQMIAAGIGSGVVIGLAITKALSRMLREYSALLISSIAFLTFGLAESIGGSGMLAVAVAGFIIGNLAIEHREKVIEFQSEFSELLRISVFTLLGAQVFLDLNPLLLIAEFLFAAFVFVLRPLIVSYLAKSKSEELGYEGFAILKFSAPRGISAAAVVPIVSAALANNAVMDIVFMVIFFTVLLSSLAANLIASGKARSMSESYDKIKAMLFGRKSEVEKSEKEKKEAGIDEP